MRHLGFTLAELLIALAILGVIATFTIPKVLNSQQSAQNISIAKESFATVSQACQNYKIENQATANTGWSDFTQYFNYVSIITTSVDGSPCFGADVDCSVAGTECFKIHNGAVLWAYSNRNFGGTDLTNGFRFWVDPDGSVTGGAGDEGKSVAGVIYYNGFTTTTNHTKAGSTDSIGAFATAPCGMPDWFSWD